MPIQFRKPNPLTNEQLYEYIRLGRIKVYFNGRHASPLLHRFWSKVNKDGLLHPKLGSKCWRWTGERNGGYGVFRSSVGLTAHRYSWHVHRGLIPGDLQVLHSCDNPECTNPDHLWLGTQLDNIADMVAKGRNDPVTLGQYLMDHPECRPRGDRNGTHTHPEKVARGETVGTSKLTSKQVQEIRRLYCKGCRRGNGSGALGRRYGVSSTTVLFIIRQKTWRHVR